MNESIVLKDGWKYYDGDPAVHAPNDKSTVYMQAKTECRLWGPAAEKYDDCAFTPVTLPHDALIARTPRPEGNEGLGYFRYHCGWYRRRFTLPEREAGARARLRFEGVATHAEVYVNGCLAGRSFGGYAPFEVDISCLARFGGENVVSVRVDSASSYEGWWYQGMGIYREVRLLILNDAHLASDGIFVHPERVDGAHWRVAVDVELENEGVRTRTLTVCAEIEDAAGATVARADAPVCVNAWDGSTATLVMNVENPALWRLSDPQMYRCRVTLCEDGEVLDARAVRFGFRTIGFDASGAFLLNGERMYINGVNCHQDFGLTGKVMPPEIAAYRVRLMKEMGANAMRLAHYPHGEAEMNALDENGMLALAETRWFSTEPEAMRQLAALIRRDRNHPSVFLWSVGNEEPLHAEARGRRIAQEMFARVRRLDPTRPVTTVVCHSPENAPVYDACDVICLNYNLNAYDELHRRYPDKPFIAGEWCATPTTRGWYAPDDAEKGRVFAGDHDPHNGFSAAREDTAAFVRARDWVAGGFQWVGVEHRGECKWPRLCSASGAVDLFLLKKDAFYQNQVLMRPEPRVHILGHWNAPAEGDTIWVYARAERVELVLNGVSMGVQDVKDGRHVEWRVPYAPGELRAVGYVNGKAACEDVRRTTGAPARLRLAPVEPGMPLYTCECVDANGKIACEESSCKPGAPLFTCECVDANGQAVPDASTLVRFRGEGGVRVVATGSDNADPVPPAVPERQMYCGQIAVYVQISAPGALIAESDDLAPARWEIG